MLRSKGPTDRNRTRGPAHCSRRRLAQIGKEFRNGVATASGLGAHFPAALRGHPTAHRPLVLLPPSADPRTRASPLPLTTSRLRTSGPTANRQWHPRRGSTCVPNLATTAIDPVRATKSRASSRTSRPGTTRHCLPTGHAKPQPPPTRTPTATTSLPKADLSATVERFRSSR
jgi:hypothetical protein